MKYLGLLSSTADGSIYQGHDLATSQTQLGLGVKERASELGGAKPGSSQICPRQYGAGQVGAVEICFSKH